MSENPLMTQHGVGDSVRCIADTGTDEVEKGSVHEVTEVRTEKASVGDVQFLTLRGVDSFYWLLGCWFEAVR